MIKGGMGLSFGFDYHGAMNIPLNHVKMLGEILEELNKEKK